MYCFGRCGSENFYFTHRSTCKVFLLFVYFQRYKDGNDCIGEHRDDEKDLVEDSPIASLSLGQTRDFIFKHAQVFIAVLIIRRIQGL